MARTERTEPVPSRDIPVLPGRPGGFGGRPGGGPPGRGPVVKPKNFRGTLARLASYLAPERKTLSLVFLFLICSALLTLTEPYLVGHAVDAMSAFSGKSASPSYGAVNFRLLRIAVSMLVLAYVAEGLFAFLQSWTMAGLSQRVVRDLRSALFGKLQKLPLAFFDSRSHGELMSRASNDIDNVNNTISQSTLQLLSGSISITGSFIMMLVLSPLLTLAALITVPLVFLLARTITKRTRLLFREQQNQLGWLNGHIEETITGVQMVKAFNHEQASIREFEEVNAKLLGASMRAQIWSGFLMPLLSVINNIGFACVAFMGGVLAVHGQITVGVIASFLIYSRQFVRPLNDLASTFNVLQSGIAGAERVFEILDEKEETEDRDGAAKLQELRGLVEFQSVTFGYVPDVPILKDVSFRAEPGSTIALIGPTGAGKTTIVNLLTRFYDVGNGQIRIDGRDIRSYTRDSLRRAFGIVLQDTYLFSGTIRDNIKYGRPEASDADMIEAAKLANADPFIRRLPNGYATELPENGSNLSQGERQLLAIARVMLAQPSILILDEATSSIDTRTERHIQEALLKLMRGRTSFVIAHRLNTIRDADAILVIDRGGIVEQGSHEELLNRRGVYYTMLQHQLKNLG